MSPIKTGRLSRRDRIRRVVLVCSSFARNLAYYRAGQNPAGMALLHEQQRGYWLQSNANFLDVAVLEWCKLLGDRNGEHFWRRIVSDEKQFEMGLLARLQMEPAEFASLVEEIRHYRDKFVAHLDRDLTMQIPAMFKAKDGVCFYHEYVVLHEAKAADLVGLPSTPRAMAFGYEQCIEEAEAVFAAAIGAAGPLPPAPSSAS
jgi:hypothetical protein